LRPAGIEAEQAQRRVVAVVGCFIGFRLGKSFDLHLEPLSSFDPVGALGVGNGDQADDAAVAALPIPGEERESAAPARYLVDVAAHVLDAENAVAEKNAVDRLPFGEILLPV